METETRLAVRPGDPTRLLMGKDGAELLIPGVVYHVVRKRGRLVLIPGEDRSTDCTWNYEPTQIAYEAGHLGGPGAYACATRAPRSAQIMQGLCEAIDAEVPYSEILRRIEQAKAELGDDVEFIRCEVLARFMCPDS